MAVLHYSHIIATILHYAVENVDGDLTGILRYGERLDGVWECYNTHTKRELWMNITRILADLKANMIDHHLAVDHIDWIGVRDGVYGMLEDTVPHDNEGVE